eukprot:3352357-Prymnesium_polylepis.1
MLPSARHRAGRFDVALERSPAISHRMARARGRSDKQARCRGVHKIPRPVVTHALLRLSRLPAMDGCAG